METLAPAIRSLRIDLRSVLQCRKGYNHGSFVRVRLSVHARSYIAAIRVLQAAQVKP